MKTALNSMPLAVRAAFQFMDIAEEEIARGKRRHRRQAATVNQTFKWLVPGELLLSKCERLYRAHVCELIGRAVAGQNMVPLSRAEVLAALSVGSLAAPPGQRAAALMAKLFAELQMGPAEAKAEPWEGSNAELLAELQHTSKLPNPRREVAAQLKQEKDNV